MMKRRSEVALRRMDRTFPPTVIEQLKDLEDQLGGRTAIVGMLTLAPLTPDLRYLLGLLGDPQNQGKTLADLCALGNVLPGKLLQELAAAALLKGKVQAAQKIGNGIAAVAEDVMQRAAPYEDACHTCAGVGTITAEPTREQPNPAPEPCEVCKGVGRLLYRPDLERQKLAIEMAQLLPKSGGLNIAVQQNNQGQRGGNLGVLEKLQALTDRVLYGSDDPATPDDAPVEGEVVDPSVRPLDA